MPWIRYVAHWLVLHKELLKIIFGGVACIIAIGGALMGLLKYRLARRQAKIDGDITTGKELLIIYAETMKQSKAKAKTSIFPKMSFETF